MTSRRSIHVVAGVFASGERFLACRRAPGKSAAGQWEFPGGKVEPGEEPEAALARELHEELDVSVTVGRLIDRSTTSVGDVGIDLACYEVTSVTGQPSASLDHDLLSWVTTEEMKQLGWAKPDLPTVEALTR